MLKTENGLSKRVFNNKFIFGYAVLMTNDSKYWDQNSFKNTFVKEFGNILNNDMKIRNGKKYNFTKNTKTIDYSKRDIRQYPTFKYGLLFSKDYSVKWDFNTLNKSNKFHIATINID